MYIPVDFIACIVFFLGLILLLYWLDRQELKLKIDELTIKLMALEAEKTRQEKEYISLLLGNGEAHDPMKKVQILIDRAERLQWCFQCPLYLREVPEDIRQSFEEERTRQQE